MKPSDIEDAIEQDRSPLLNTYTISGHSDDIIQIDGPGLGTGYALTCHLSFVYDVNIWVDSGDFHINHLNTIFYVSLFGNITVTLLNVVVYLESQYRKLK